MIQMARVPYAALAFFLVILSAYPNGSDGRLKFSEKVPFSSKTFPRFKKYFGFKKEAAEESASSHLDDRARLMSSRAWKFDVVPKLILFQRYEILPVLTSETVDAAFLLILAFLDDVIKSQSLQSEVAKMDSITSLTLSMKSPLIRNEKAPQFTGEKNPNNRGDRGFYVQLGGPNGQHADLGLVMFYNEKHPFFNKFDRKFLDFTSVLFYKMATASNGSDPSVMLTPPKSLLDKEGIKFKPIPTKGVFLTFPKERFPNLGKDTGGTTNDVNRGMVHLPDVLPYNAQVRTGRNRDSTGYYVSLPQAVQI